MSRKKSAQIGKILGVGVRIRKIRGELIQEDFGNLFGVQGSAVSKWEKGKLPDEDILKRIAEHGRVTVDWLLRGDQALPLREHAPEEYSAILSDLEAALLTEVLIKVKEVIKSRRLKLTAAQEARLIVKVYDNCRAAHEHPSTIHVEKILLLRD